MTLSDLNLTFIVTVFYTPAAFSVSLVVSGVRKSALIQQKSFSKTNRMIKDLYRRMILSITPKVLLAFITIRGPQLFLFLGCFFVY